MTARIDFSRITDAVDVNRMQRSEVTAVGVGGLSTFSCDLVRCGLSRLNAVDLDVVEASNVARQEHYLDMVGTPKVTALAHQIKRINPEAIVRPIQADFCKFSDDEIRELFGNTDVFVFGTDSHAAQARGNEVALMLRKPAVWIGLYVGGRAAEVAFWHPGIRSCYRCLCGARYDAFEKGFQNPRSDGATILDVHSIDSIAGMVTIGLLTRGSDNRHGRLIDQLGDRNFIQMKIDPEWRFNGRDVIRDKLGVPDGNDAYFSFTAVALRDPDGGEPPCPDCVKYLGRIAKSSLSNVPPKPATDDDAETGRRS